MTRCRDGMVVDGEVIAARRIGPRKVFHYREVIKEFHHDRAVFTVQTTDLEQDSMLTDTLLPSDDEEGSPDNTDNPAACDDNNDDWARGGAAAQTSVPDEQLTYGQFEDGQNKDGQSEDGPYDDDVENYDAEEGENAEALTPIADTAAVTAPDSEAIELGPRGDLPTPLEHHAVMEYSGSHAYTGSLNTGTGTQAANDAQMTDATAGEQITESALESTISHDRDSK